MEIIMTMLSSFTIWEQRGRRRGFAILTPSDEGLGVYDMMEGAA
jgi:hypothetical protein